MKDKENKLYQIIKNTVKSSTNIQNNEILNILTKKFPFSRVISEEEYNLIKPVIEEFGLDDPKKLIKWLVDLHFAGIESINAGIATVRKDLLSSEISKISAVREKINTTYENDNQLTGYMEQLIDVISDIEGKITDYIQEIDEIDNLPRYKFFLMAIFNKGKVATAIQLIKASLNAYYEALNIYIVIANQKYRNKGNEGKVKKYLENKKKFINNLSFSLLLAYDNENDESFWNKDKKKEEIDKIEKISENISEYLQSEIETEVENFEDINFGG